MPDSLVFEPDPTHWHVVQVHRETTQTGLPCQVHLILDYDNGEPRGTRKITVNPGLLRDYKHLFPEPEGWDSEEDGDYLASVFQALWNLIPDVPQSVKDTIGAQIPADMARDFWLRQKG